MGTYTQYFTTPGTYSFQLPWSAEIKALRGWGGGGCGGNATTTNTAAGGGGGGAFAEADTKTLLSYNYYGLYYVDLTVPEGCSPEGVEAQEVDPAIIRIRTSEESVGEGTIVVQAGGGQNVTPNGSVAGSGGTVDVGTGYSGGSGAAGNILQGYSGGGGGGAGINAAGGNASQNVGGTGSGTYGGNGGNGRTSVGNGTNGTASGGGGGGAARTSSGSYAGGSGASGRAYIDVSWPDNINLFIPDNTPNK